MFSPKLSAAQNEIFSVLSNDKKPIERRALIRKVYGKPTKSCSYDRQKDIFNSDLSNLRVSSHAIKTGLLCLTGRETTKSGKVKKYTKYTLSRMARVTLLA
jgi:hypothetical protein